MINLSDIEIARNTKLNNIVDVAKEIGINEDNLELYGKYKAKISKIFTFHIKNTLFLVTT